MPSCLALNRRGTGNREGDSSGPSHGTTPRRSSEIAPLSPPFPFPRKSTSFFCDLPHPLFRCPSLSFSLSTTSSLPARRRRRPRVWLTLWAPHKFRKPPFPSLSDRPRTLRTSGNRFRTPNVSRLLGTSFVVLEGFTQPRSGGPTFTSPSLFLLH